MNPDSLTPENGALLISIMSAKARNLNETFMSSFWTPRKIDKVLWAVRDQAAATISRRATVPEVQTWLDQQAARIRELEKRVADLEARN